MDLYLEHYDKITDAYTKVLEMFNFDIIVYDETELFRDSDDP